MYSVGGTPLVGLLMMIKTYRDEQLSFMGDWSVYEPIEEHIRC